MFRVPRWLRCVSLDCCLSRGLRQWRKMTLAAWRSCTKPGWRPSRNRHIPFIPICPHVSKNRQWPSCSSGGLQLRCFCPQRAGKLPGYSTTCSYRQLCGQGARSSRLLRSFTVGARKSLERRSSPSGSTRAPNMRSGRRSTPTEPPLGRSPVSGWTAIRVRRRPLRAVLAEAPMWLCREIGSLRQHWLAGRRRQK